MPPLKEAGLDKLAYLYGFDEVNDEVFPRIKEIFGMVHSLYPGLPTMTTGYDNTFGRTTGLRDYVDIWVPLIPGTTWSRPSGCGPRARRCGGTCAWARGTRTPTGSSSRRPSRPGC